MSQSPKKPAGPPPPSIPGYRLDGVLGKGATGVVYLARQQSIDREVALKVLHPELVRNMRSVKRLQREARTAARLTHPNLISAIDMGQTETSWWFAMELVHGESLARHLEQRGRFKEERALPIFILLCDALQHACDRGVVHRDIKPENILLEKGDFPRLVDLGLARVEDDPLITRTGATLGTPHYISPEQARDPALADIRSDIWSLGATMFHTFCGQPPFCGTSAAEILSGVLYGPISDPLELRPNLSRGMALVLRKCLSRDPDRRYFNPVELGEDLERVLAHKPPAIKVSSLEPLDQEAEQGGRRGLLITALVVAVALAATLFVWQPWNRSWSGAPEIPRVIHQPWPRVGELIEDVEKRGLSLASAFGELEVLETQAPPGSRSELDAARAFLQKRLEVALNDFWKIVEHTIRGAIDERRFTDAEVYLDSGLKKDLEAAIGFTELLPRRRDREQLARRVAGYRSALKGRRDAALAAAVTAIDSYGRSVFLPRIDHLQRQGEWTQARQLLLRDLHVLHAEAPCDLRGLDPTRIDERLGGLRKLLEKRAARLENDWGQLDSTLRNSVGALADRAEGRLRSRDVLHGTVELDRGFETLLTKHRLDQAKLEAAPSHTSLDLFLERMVVLLNLEERLLEEHAKERFQELEEASREFHARRDYRGAERFWRGQLDAEGLALIHETVVARFEEARLLREFLDRAAVGVRSLEGEVVSLSQGGIVVPGTVVLKGDPLKSGLRLILSTNSQKDFCLLPGRGSPCDLLEPRAVEFLASEGTGSEGERELLLARALFRFREGDVQGADELFEPRKLTDLSPVEKDLARRLAEQRGDADQLHADRRAAAEKALLRATDNEAAARDSRAQVLAIRHLLMEYGDVLEMEEDQLLRSRRRALEAAVPPSTLGEFREVFGASEVSFPSFDLVRMRFILDSSDVGAWQRGTWHFDGDSSWRGTPMDDLLELAGQSAPTLLLRDPLRVGEGQVRIAVRLFQPVDSPPELFLISALGFHVAIAGPQGNRGGSVVADTGELLTVATHATRGEGTEFPGLASGEEHRIDLILSRGSGKAVVEIDGRRVLSVICNTPHDRVARAALSFRSLEPVRVMEVWLEGKRR
jgi:tRNA A-37 threonylcarbamoyl transferase component Bud32